MEQIRRSSGGRRPARTRGTSAWPSLLLGFFMVAFLCGFAYSGYLLYMWSRSVVAGAPQLPSLPLPRLGLPAIVRPSVPVLPAATPEPETGFFSLLAPWEKKERLNLLLLGDDRRPDELGPHLTDTIIVLSIDPEQGDAGMLSIPRDLWVPIPGYGENRVNMAFVLGELRDYPGGGPALAKKTTEELLGYPIHHYAMVNFDGFKQVIDLVGCVDVYVAEDIDDPDFPDNNYGYDPLFIPAGHHCMDGELALKYARTRRQGADYARARRQQQVLLALKDKLLEQNVLTGLLPKLPQLASGLGDAVQTDLPLDKAITLARMANQLDLDSIEQLVIDETLTTPSVTEGGAWVLLPNREEIRPLVDDLFQPPPPVSEEELRAQQEQIQAQQQQVVVRTPEAQPAVSDERRQIAEEAARIVVHNGTLREGLAVRTTEWLETQGFLVVSFGNADSSDYSHTVLVDYSGKQFTVQRLAELFRVLPENSRTSSNLKSQVDVRLILGQDWQVP
jgi:LCP family protein required for cell wall assembly